MEDLEELVEGTVEDIIEDSDKSDENKVSVRAKIMLVTDEAIFGPGPVMLLRYIDETGSVRQACEDMGLSYSKGWQLLNKMEDGLGFKVIKRFHGGAGGGKSELTDNGRYMVDKYLELKVRSKIMLDQLFEEIFADLDKLEDEAEEE